jgi:LmbE family N-acetylglucosaminyl deacetylase
MAERGHGGIPADMSPQRVLLLVPHPDDEAVGCAVALRRAVAAGAEVFALYLTTGVPPLAVLWPWQRRFYEARVARRRAETRQAAQRIGITALAALDWPARTLKAHLDEALALIRATVAAHAIGELWAPAWEGAHQDHDVANFLAAQMEGQCPVTEFAEYNFHGGRVQSGRFADPDGSEEIIALTPQEAAWKRQLLATYASERGNLAHIACASEALRPLRPHDYARRPLAGWLFYERFQWVPFRHPRIDFERPERVCATLAAFRPQPAPACAVPTRPLRGARCASSSPF